MSLILVNICCILLPARDAMHERCICCCKVSVRPSVCYDPVLCQSDLF